MGMFDDIIEVPAQQCHGCGAALEGWQSKDGPCRCEELPFWKVREFYTSCRKCGMWHQFDRVIDPPRTPLADYQLSVRPKESDWSDLRMVGPPDSASAESPK